jgi:hypothetical protein
MFPIKKKMVKGKGKKKTMPKKKFPMNIGKKVMNQQNSQYFGK